jgi:hypothetical protein
VKYLEGESLAAMTMAELDGKIAKLRAKISDTVRDFCSSPTSILPCVGEAQKRADAAMEHCRNLCSSTLVGVV